jgi:hypothetical protein
MTQVKAHECRLQPQCVQVLSRVQQEVQRLGHTQQDIPLQQAVALLAAATVHPSVHLQGTAAAYPSVHLLPLTDRLQAQILAQLDQVAPLSTPGLSRVSGAHLATLEQLVAACGQAVKQGVARPHLLSDLAPHLASWLQHFSRQALAHLLAAVTAQYGSASAIAHEATMPPHVVSLLHQTTLQLSRCLQVRLCTRHPAIVTITADHCVLLVCLQGASLSALRQLLDCADPDDRDPLLLHAVQRAATEAVARSQRSQGSKLAAVLPAVNVVQVCIRAAPHSTKQHHRAAHGSTLHFLHQPAPCICTPYLHVHYSCTLSACTCVGGVS